MSLFYAKVPVSASQLACFRQLLQNRPSHPRGGRSGNFRGSKNQNSGKCHELSRKSIKFVFFTHPSPGGSGGGWGSKFQKSGKFHELSRKSIKKSPPPPKGVAVGILGGKKIKRPGNVMNCPENI